MIDVFNGTVVREENLSMFSIDGQPEGKSKPERLLHLFRVGCFTCDSDIRMNKILRCLIGVDSEILIYNSGKIEVET